MESVTGVTLVSVVKIVVIGWAGTPKFVADLQSLFDHESSTGAYHP